MGEAGSRPGASKTTAVDLARTASLATYAALGLGVAYGRPPLRGARAPGTRALEQRSGSLLGEAAWLAVVGVVFLYPLAVFVLPRTFLAPPLSFFAGPALPAVGVGLALVVAASILLATSFLALGRFTTPRLEIVTNHEIVRIGPYARIRHPMYTAVLLAAVGIAIEFSGLVLLPFVAAIAAAAWLRARAEERLFLASPRLGAEYAQYRTETGRFLPGRRR